MGCAGAKQVGPEKAAETATAAEKAAAEQANKFMYPSVDESFVAHEGAWASGTGGVPKSLLVDVTSATIGQIGPLSVEVSSLERQSAQLQQSLDACDDGTPLQLRSKIEHELHRTRSSAAEAKEALSGALDRLNRLKLSTSRAISRPLANDAARYDAAMQTMAEAEPTEQAALQTLVERLVNCGPLSVGEYVQLI